MSNEGKGSVLRLVQAGLGGWGRDWARRIVSRSSEVAVTAIVDADAAALARAGEETGIEAQRRFTSLEEALAAVEADAVLITASLPGHAPLVRTALEAGRHVLVEKPFAPTVAEAEELVSLAERRQRVLMVSQNYRFHGAVEAVRDLVRQGSMGAVSSVGIDFRRLSEGERHFRLDQPLLVDMAIHHFDLMRHVLGQDANRIFCWTWNPAWSRFQSPPAGAAVVTFDAGAVVSYRGSWISRGPITPWAGEWRMELEGGEVVWTSRGDMDSHLEEVEIRPLKGEPRSLELRPTPWVDRAGSLHEFVAAVTEGREPISSGRANLGSLALVAASVASATSGEPVDLISPD
ncbi:MAG TPA: Gfo/Idh/MocA family oxidoreductase [Candidatus Dormibacteraeota bacterium]|jgi:predicted dehydrogenase|nr:Gfo/Idh/MocA family oxidoreductase [Candidatus Dormibacteraeota bacterium]